MAPAAQGFDRLQVLVVEDTPANQKLIQRVLERRGHVVEAAADGHEAMSLVAQRDFDLILMDVRMPAMDGCQTASAIRAMAERCKARVPIVGLSAYTTRADHDRCLSSGMDAYLAKPLDTRELVAMVERLAGRHTLPAQVSHPHREKPPAYAEVDFSAALRRLGGDRELLREVVQIFLDDAPHLLERISAAVGEGNAAAVERTAHSLKGLAANFSATQPVATLQAIEDWGRRGDLREAAAMLPELERRIRRLEQVLHFVGWTSVRPETD